MRTDTATRTSIARRRDGALLIVLLLSGALLAVAPTAPASGNFAGKTVVLDPGHNGIADASISHQVPNGRGGTKPCNTSGTSAADGYPEHAFTWAVTQRIRDALEQQGIHTVLTRDSDGGVGPCVDQRAALANAARPDAIVSVHADGGPPSGSGFHVNYSSPPLTDVQRGPTVALATAMRDALVASGLREATYIGSQGLYGRADLAGLNLAEYPAVLVELGNMKNAGDAGRIESADGRTQYAAAVTRGITTYLGGR